MKNRTKICLLISFILFLIGGSMVFYAFSRVGFDWNDLTVNVQNETFDYTVSGTVQDIIIDSKQADVHVVRSSNSTCTVCAKIASRSGCNAETDAGVLTVTCSDDPSLPWYKKLWRQDETKVTVFLPNDAYNILKIKTGSGDVYVSDALSFTTAVTKTASGDQEIYAPVSNALSATSESGDIAIKRMGCKTISAKSESGEIILDSGCSDSVTAVASSGNVYLSKYTAKNVQTNTASGDIVFSQIVVSEHLDVTSSSGDILYMFSTAADMKITAKSGDVTGRLIEPMLFDVHSDSGDLVLPPSSGTSRCTVRTGSGDITFTMAEDDEG